MNLGFVLKYTVFIDNFIMISPGAYSKDFSKERGGGGVTVQCVTPRVLITTLSCREHYNIKWKISTSRFLHTGFYCTVLCELI